MKSAAIVLVCTSLLLLAPGTARAQDPAKADPAHYKVVLDNPSARVLRIAYPVGDKSRMHQHPDSMVVVLSDNGKTRFATPDGKTVDQTRGANTAMYTPATTHDPSNIGTVPAGSGWCHTCP